MKRLLLLLVPLAGACAAAPAGVARYDRPLRADAPALIPITNEWALPDFGPEWEARDEIAPALERSIDWTSRESSKKHFPIAGITHERALRSLQRFRELLQGAQSREEFNAAFRAEFAAYKSAGWDSEGGGVLFTAYCTPVFEGRLSPDGRFQYPLHGLPPDLVKGQDGEILGWETRFGLLPYPSRRAIQASNVLLEQKGLELVWLGDPLDAYIAHVNGSAFVDVPGKGMLRLGYAGKNGRAYTSLGKELLDDARLSRSELDLAGIRRWASEHPAEVDEYLGRNDSYVFFQPIDGNPRGSLNVEVQPRRSLATDKTLFPRGALVFADAELPDGFGGGVPFRQFLFDQDTGGAIRTAGRADIYMGIGIEAEELAGGVASEGQLFYFFLKE